MHLKTLLWLVSLWLWCESSSAVLVVRQATLAQTCLYPTNGTHGECTNSSDCVLDTTQSEQSAECTVALCEKSYGNTTCRFLPANAYMPCELPPEETEPEPSKHYAARRDYYGYYHPTPTPLPEVEEPESGICDKRGVCARCSDVKQCVHGTCEFEENPIVSGALVAKCWCEEGWLGHACDTPDCNFKGAWSTESHSCECFGNYTGANCTECAGAPSSSDETFRCVRLETDESKYALVKLLKSEADAACLANRSVVPGKNGTDCLCNAKEDEALPPPVPTPTKHKSGYDYSIKRRRSYYAPTPTPVPEVEEKEKITNEETLLEQLKWCKDECLEGLVNVGNLYRNNNDTCNSGLDLPLSDDLPLSHEEDPARAEVLDTCSDQTSLAASPNHYPVLQFDDTAHHYASSSYSPSLSKDDFYATLTTPYDRCYAVGCPRKDAELVNQKYTESSTMSCAEFCSSNAAAPAPSPSHYGSYETPSGYSEPSVSFCDHLACLDNFVSECATEGICTTTPEASEDHYDTSIQDAWEQIKTLNPDKLDDLEAYEAANAPIDELDVALFSASFQSCFLNGCAANATKTQSCLDACSDYSASNSVFCRLFFQQGKKSGLLDANGTLSCSSKPTQAKCASYCASNAEQCESYCASDNRAFECCAFCGDNTDFPGCGEVCGACTASSASCLSGTTSRFDDAQFTGLFIFSMLLAFLAITACICIPACRKENVADILETEVY